MSRSLRYHLEETDMTSFKIKGTAPMPPDELLPENDPGDLDSDYTPLQHLQANLKTENQLAKKAGKENG